MEEDPRTSFSSSASRIPIPSLDVTASASCPPPPILTGQSFGNSPSLSPRELDMIQRNLLTSLIQMTSKYLGEPKYVRELNGYLDRTCQRVPNLNSPLVVEITGDVDVSRTNRGQGSIRWRDSLMHKESFEDG